jgi:hypothetical protein
MQPSDTGSTPRPASPPLQLSSIEARFDLFGPCDRGIGRVSGAASARSPGLSLTPPHERLPLRHASARLPRL